MSRKFLFRLNFRISNDSNVAVKLIKTLEAVETYERSFSSSKVWISLMSETAKGVEETQERNDRRRSRVQSWTFSTFDFDFEFDG